MEHESGWLEGGGEALVKLLKELGVGRDGTDEPGTDEPGTVSDAGGFIESAALRPSSGRDPADIAAERECIDGHLAALMKELDAIDNNKPAAVSLQPIKPARSQLGYWVKLTQARLSKTQARVLRKHGLIASELAVLRQLYGPQRRSIVELGQAIGMSKGGVSKLVARLVSKGFVQKYVSEYDRRWRTVELTRHGKSTVPVLVAAEEGVDREFFALLTPRRRRRLMNSLEEGLAPPPRHDMELWLLLEKKRGLVRFNDDRGSSHQVLGVSGTPGFNIID